MAGVAAHILDMSTSTFARQPKGIPVGGQFATHDRAEADIDLSLAGIASESDWLDRNGLSLPPLGQAEFEARLARLGHTPTDLDRADIFREVQRELLGYEQRDLLAFSQAVDTLRATGYGDLADRTDRLVTALMDRQPHPAPLPKPGLPVPLNEAPAVREQRPAPRSFEDVALAAQRPADDPANILALNLPHIPSIVDDAGQVPGNVFDQMRSCHRDGVPVLFTRAAGHTRPDEPTMVRIQVDRELTAEEMSQLESLTGYAMNSAHRGATGVAHRDTAFSIVVPIQLRDERDVEKDDERFRLFEKRIGQLLSEGSQVRQTDRSGPGTAGTRAIEPFARPPRFVVYYDSVRQA